MKKIAIKNLDEKRLKQYLFEVEQFLKDAEQKVLQDGSILILSDAIKIIITPRWKGVKDMARNLPIIKIGSKKYFVDERLNELRNVENAHDAEKMEGSAELYVRIFGCDNNLYEY